MKFIRMSFIVAMAYLLQSCFNSDDYIFNESDATSIIIQASLARSLGESASNVKADTFHINDTVYFQTTVSPNKIIKVQDYHWLMDGKYCASEYNFKKELSDPGYHKFKFVLKDYFGDMHYDSLEVWVSDNPVLNDSVFTPADGTQAIDPYESIYFTWSAKTEGIKLAHYYHFLLSEQSFANAESKFTTIDTILNEPHFTYHNKLNSFKKYNWTVQAFNEYNFASAQKIQSSFFTKGFPGEGSLQAKVDIGQASTTPIRIALQDKSNSEKRFDYNLKLSSTNNEISLDAIPAGKYQLNIQSDYADFGTIQKDITINDGFVTTENDLKLIDTIAPTITSTTGQDTLDFADTLRFIVKDGSRTITHSSVKAYLENETALEKDYTDSILTVVLKETDKSWTYRVLTVSASDGSKNVSNKSFYILPSTLWFTTNNDTTITNDALIKFFIQENNPYGFAIDSLKFFNVTKNKTIISVSRSEGKSFTAELEASLFDAEQTIKSIVIYKNGLQQSKTWKLYVKPAKKGEE